MHNILLWLLSYLNDPTTPKELARGVNDVDDAETYDGIQVIDYYNVTKDI